MTIIECGIDTCKFNVNGFCDKEYIVIVSSGIDPICITKEEEGV